MQPTGNRYQIKRKLKGIPFSLDTPIFGGNMGYCKSYNFHLPKQEILLLQFTFLCNIFTFLYNLSKKSLHSAAKATAHLANCRG